MFLFFSLVFPLVSSNPIVSCYYRYNDPPVEKVPGHICTHIILIGNTVLDHLGHFQQPDDAVAKEFVSIKKKFSDVKLLLCETGENADFSTLVSDEETMQRFAKESAAYLRKWKMDGLDLDWEFPTWSWDASKSDKYKFTSLLKTLREDYDSDLLLTAAVSGPPTITRRAYEVHAFNRYLDFVNVMNYDFHVYNFLTNPVVGFNAPLRRMRGEEGPIGEMNSEASMATYRQLGLWENKTLFGIPTYNLAFRLVNYWIHKPFALAEGSVDGFGDRSTICKIMEDKHTYKYVWNEKAASPYIWGKNKIWISMEDERSVSRKAAYAMQLGVAGVMIFHIGSDDVHGSCGNGEYPLLKAISKEVHTQSNKV